MHSSISFSIKHLVVSSVRGKFKDVSGSADFDATTSKLQDINASINVASIDTDNEKRDGHLQSPDFFDAQKYPTLSFKSTKINREKDKYTVVGDLTIKGVTKSITLKGNLVGTLKDKDMGNKAGFVAEGKINRNDFGISWNKTLEMGGLALGDEVSLLIEVEMTEEVAVPAAK